MIMDISYDEDLSQNPFLEALKKDHYLILQLAIHEGWIICVPRRGSYVKDFLSKQDANEHILIPNEDFPKSNFETLSNKKVLFQNGVLTIKYNTIESFSLRLLFEETFYCDSLKYRVWCIEHPLNCEPTQIPNQLTVVISLYDAISLLWSELQKKTLTTLEFSVKEYLQLHVGLQNKSLQALRDSTFSLYSRNIKTILKDERLKNSNHLLQNIKVALETYILHALRGILPRLVAANVALEDAALNKIIRNLGDLGCEDLAIRADLQGSVQRGKLELSRLSQYTTVLEKLECLKRSIRNISHGVQFVSSDDLLPVLVYIIVKAGLPNWVAQVAFIKNFRFSAISGSDADENAYMITTLEAALEYIKSDALAKNDKFNFYLEQNRGTRENLEDLFRFIKNGELLEVEQLLSTMVDPPCNISMCHPLCTCESCEQSLVNIQHLKRPTVSSTNERGLTALHVAAFYGQAAIVDYLLTHGADPNAFDSNSATPLYYAASKGQQNIVLLLLHANANPRLGDVHSDTPLHVAADRGHEGCVKALLYFAEHTDLWIDVNSANLNGDTPLHRASKWGYLGIIEVLLEYGAECKAKNKWGQTPFDLAQSESVTILLQRIVANSILNTCPIPRGIRFRRSSHIFQRMASEEDKLKEKYSNQISVTSQKSAKLFAAIMEGDVQLANYYLGFDEEESNATVKVSLGSCHPLCDCERCVPLIEFSKKQKKIPAMIFNLRNDNGETILHVACATGCTEIVRLLLDAGANINVTTKYENRTSLHLASLFNKIHIVKVILRCATCNIDAKDFNGDTALHLAARKCNIKIMELLIRAGANTSIRNSKNTTARLELEKQMSKDVVVKILKCNSLEYPGYCFSGINQEKHLSIDCT